MCHSHRTTYPFTAVLNVGKCLMYTLMFLKKGKTNEGIQIFHLPRQILTLLTYTVKV